jgi:hypothetical protein
MPQQIFTSVYAGVTGPLHIPAARYRDANGISQNGLQRQGLVPASGDAPGGAYDPAGLGAAHAAPAAHDDMALPPVIILANSPANRDFMV